MIRNPRIPALLLAVSLLGACGDRPDFPAKGETLEQIRTLPHDRSSYTQGLVYSAGDEFIESAGLYGESSLRRVDIESGEVIQRKEIDDQYFAEGLVELDGRLYQLTWQHGVGFVYSADSFELLDSFQYTGEGWGLTTDGRSLILSDGTYRLRFINPITYRTERVVEAKDQGRVIYSLNELEWVDGEIWANIYQEDNIARIDPENGEVIGWVNVQGFVSAWDRLRGAEVANGIAWDSAGDRLWVTGKKWPKVFQVVRPS